MGSGKEGNTDFATLVHDFENAARRKLAVHLQRRLDLPDCIVADQWGIVRAVVGAASNFVRMGPATGKQIVVPVPFGCVAFRPERSWVIAAYPVMG